MTDSSLNLKCKCGAFEAKFSDAPLASFNCHCHSCVTAIKTIESKPEFEGISHMDGAGGVNIALYSSSNVTIITDMKSEEAKALIGFVKVGENGDKARPYCKKCGTAVFNVWKKNWCGVNRNLLTTSDGTPYKPEGELMNILKSAAFDQSKVPEPSCMGAPESLMAHFGGLMDGSISDGSNDQETALTPEDMSKVEVAAITWE